MQITVGLMLLTILFLSVAVHPGFIWLAAIPGLGLTMAGLTGFCKLAPVLAIMPWNR